MGSKATGYVASDFETKVTYNKKAVLDALLWGSLRKFQLCTCHNND